MKSTVTLLALLLLASYSLRAADEAAGGGSSAESAPRPEKKGPAASVDAKLKSFSIDCEGWQDGLPPEEVFVVDGIFKVVTKDGSKALMIEPAPIVDACAQVGESAAGTSIVQAKIMASKRGRSYPRFGVSVHGMSGHRLFVNCAKKQVELVRGEETLATAPCAWTTDTWMNLKLEAVLNPDETWSFKGKAWPGGSEEPKEPAIQHTEPKGKIKGNGKVTLWGTPFSELPLYIDDVKVQVATKN